MTLLLVSSKCSLKLNVLRLTEASRVQEVQHKKQMGNIKMYDVYSAVFLAVLNVVTENKVLRQIHLP